MCSLRVGNLYGAFAEVAEGDVALLRISIAFVFIRISAIAENALYVSKIQAVLLQIGLALLFIPSKSLLIHCRTLRRHIKQAEACLDNVSAQRPCQRRLAQADHTNTAPPSTTWVGRWRSRCSSGTDRPPRYPRPSRPVPPAARRRPADTWRGAPVPAFRATTPSPPIPAPPRSRAAAPAPRPAPVSALRPRHRRWRRTPSRRVAAGWRCPTSA